MIKKDMQQELDDNDLSIMFSETSGGGKIAFRSKDDKES
jgi:hypothetical protein